MLQGSRGFHFLPDAVCETGNAMLWYVIGNILFTRTNKWEK